MKTWCEDGSTVGCWVVEAALEDSRNPTFMQIQEALERGKTDDAKILIANLQEDRQNYLDKLLWFACAYDNHFAIPLLLECGANPSARIPTYGPPGIVFGIYTGQDQKGRKKRLELLIEHGFNLNQQDSHGHTLLHNLVDEHRNQGLITLVVELGANYKKRNRQWLTPSNIALRWGNDETFLELKQAIKSVKRNRKST